METNGTCEKDDSRKLAKKNIQISITNSLDPARQLQKWGPSGQRKQDDADAFQKFVDKNNISYFSHKGYVQWKGSDAQKLAKKHVNDKMQERMKYRAIYEAYNVYYENYPFKAFKDHYRSEIRLAKYIKHRNDFGETHKTGKPQPEPDSDSE